mgnify:CR=1 FL=1
MDEKEYAGRCRFVGVDTKREPISGGHWIEIKKMLSIGEIKRIEGAGITRVTVPGQAPTTELDYAEYSFTRMDVYLTDWSLKNKEGKDIAVSPSAIRALDEDTFDEIEAVLSAHVEALAAKKKARLGAREQNTR